ncbi:hypothetical protein [Paenibacillus sp. FSL L8-0708]|uniref:hypothetical protein n=1 Tax=Paenibacillus sp. FSL L8-0708 TaxID=2975311 RepID=UPI0030F552C2
MAGKGWIKLHRKILENPIFNDMQLYRLWSICLLEASYKEREQTIGRQTILLQPGQFVTGRFDIQELYNRGLKEREKAKGEKTVFRWLEHLERRGFLTINKTNKYSIVTIGNWELYQSDDELIDHQNDQEKTIKRPTNDQQMTTNKKVKKEKNDKKKDIKDLSAEIFNFRSRYSPELSKIIDQYLDFIRETRSSKKIADSIVLKILTYFSKYSSVQVEYAILQHMSMEEKQSAPEAYTFGIIRKCTEAEAVRKLQQLRSGKQSAGGFDRDAYLANLSEE